MIEFKVHVGIDVMSLVHPLVANFPGVDQKMWIEKIIPSWIAKMGNPFLWLPSLQPEPLCYGVYFLLDEKDPDHKYWRHEHHPGYKSGRRSHSDILRWVKMQLVASLERSGFPVLSSPGFEADDWAGELVRALGKDDRLFLVSVDGDWGQLVSDRVVWLDTYCATKRKHPDQVSRVLDRYSVIRRFNSYEKHSTFPIQLPYQIVDLKHVLGDPSDSIPGKRSVPRGIIDLVSPLKYPVPVDLYDLWAQSTAAIRPSAADVPMHALGLPEFHNHTVDLDSMLALEGSTDGTD